MNKVLSVIVFLTISMSVKAQHAYILGVSGSFNSAWIQYQDIYGEINDNGLSRGLEYKLTYGYSIGVEAGYIFNPKMSLLIEPMYSTQGQNYKATFTGYDITRHVHLNYYKLPMVFKYLVGVGKAKFYFGGGGEYNRLNYANIAAQYNGVSSNGNHSGDDAYKRFNKYDPAIVLIVGGQYTLSETVYLDAGIRSDYSLSDINAKGYRIVNNHGVYHASHNATAGINAGIHFQIGRTKKDPFNFSYIK